MSAMQPARGTKDLIGDTFRRHHHVVETARHVASLYGLEEWATPIFEDTRVFARSLGETSDVVSKEMYSFEDRGGDSLTLRPEGTAGVCRALVSNGLTQGGLPRKVFYAGPMFRYERPQKGRFRQFHQIGAEILGAAEPLADAEVIAMGWQIIQQLGVDDGVVLEINTLGDQESRRSYRDALVEYLSGHEAALSEESQKRLRANPLRILDSKDEGDRKIVADAPTIHQHLTPAAAEFYGSVKTYLERFGVPYRENPRIVRGLDYYSHTAFEFITDRLGAQGTVLGGGRYEGLVGEMGGPPTPSVGWAAGVERLAELLEEVPDATQPVAIVPVSPAEEGAALDVLQMLRVSGVPAEIAYRGNLKKRMERANRVGSPAAIILGESEIADEVVVVRNLSDGSQQRVPLAGLLPALASAGVVDAMLEQMIEEMEIAAEEDGSGEE
ncbi:histidine--tRNA ligase [Pseudoroseomonas globiformis]|uniref:Histidine--tRNA ligase n=1 Tax=Teichococcus globiformis TaxID=2307229 RepID=A0ABV7G5I0_9PROT